MSIQDQFEQHIDASFALASVVKPSTTVAELRKLIKAHPPLGNTLLRVLTDGPPTAAIRRAPTLSSILKGYDPKTERITKTPRKGTKHVDTRTDAGRSALDVKVFEVVQRLKVGVAAASFASLGANPAQIRSSLNRLINNGSVTWTGKARGTRYHLAE